MISSAELDRWHETVIEVAAELDHPELDPDLLRVACVNQATRLATLSQELHQRYLDALRREMESLG